MGIHVTMIETEVVEYHVAIAELQTMQTFTVLLQTTIVGHMVDVHTPHVHAPDKLQDTRPDQLSRIAWGAPIFFAHQQLRQINDGARRERLRNSKLK